MPTIVVVDYVVMRGDKLENGGFRPRILWGKQNLRVVRGRRG